MGAKDRKNSGGGILFLRLARETLFSTADSRIKAAFDGERKQLPDRGVITSPVLEPSGFGRIYFKRQPT